MLKQKVCTRCEETKPVDSFGVNQHHKFTDGRQTWCKPCGASYKRDKRWSSPAKAQYDYQRQLRKNERDRVFAETRALSKECRGCEESLPATSEHFYRANGKLGFASCCKACDNLKRKERRQRGRAQ